jgi:hypothetical protein
MLPIDIQTYVLSYHNIKRIDVLYFVQTGMKQPFLNPTYSFHSTHLFNCSPHTIDGNGFWCNDATGSFNLLHIYHKFWGGPIL